MIINLSFAAEKVVKVPPMADSITEGTLSKWHKSECFLPDLKTFLLTISFSLFIQTEVGEYVARDEPIATIETDKQCVDVVCKNKVDVTVNSPEAGEILELMSNEGDTVAVGGNLLKVDLDGKGTVSAEAPAPAAAAPPPPAPAATPSTPPPPAPKAAPAPTPAVATPAASTPKPAAAPAPKSAAAPATDAGFNAPGSRVERRVKMSRMRLRIAERLKESQSVAASLTTFNEVDMSNLIEMRNKYKDLVLEKHGIKLGFMSAFIAASTAALKAIPEVNARIEGNEIVYSDFVDISVAVATPKGLVTPVIRNCEQLSMLDAEKTLAELGKKAKDNLIQIEDMAGGTFTISNGGVFGSMMGTPIINQPQSAILGMHGVKDRAVVINGKVEVRPMMYIALTYDHRMIDGREAVTFLVKVKEIIEDPRRLLLNV
ncbi:2-oxoglutarate dehydrogenase complex E2 component [Phlyctochytrium planicorne]|nr:2-oxoglutarate dehydrogenase complex E2 component [Phlyctochytrium planicorne]